MRKFPIMSMAIGDDVTVTTPNGTIQGIVQETSYKPDHGGWAVQVKVFGAAGYEWFYVRDGAKFWR